MRRYRLPYWAFVPTLGVWPGAGATGTGDAANDTAVPLPKSGAVAVNMNSGRVTVVDARPEVNASAAPVVVANQLRRRQSVKPPQQHPNTPSVGGPSWLRKTTVAATEAPAHVVSKEDTVPVTAKPVTKIFLKPSARAKAGPGGVALSNPISTAVVRRGDTVSIEYLPDATAEVGEGGVAISRPELVIHFID